MVSGALITPNVVLFSPGGFRHEFFLGANVTIGNRFSRQEFRSVESLVITPVHIGFGNLSYGLALLDSISSKTPVAVDDGSCVFEPGCLDVTLIGRGTTSFEGNEKGYSPLGFTARRPSLDQVLQQFNVRLQQNTDCIGEFDPDTAYYDLLVEAYETYYGCPGLDCEGVNETAIITAANHWQTLARDELSAYFENMQTAHTSGEASCIRNLKPGTDLCRGDAGAPTLVKDRDILVGMFLRFIDSCLFDGVNDLFPVSIHFTASIVDQIRDDLANMPGANSNLISPDPRDCSCVLETSSAKELKANALALFLVCILFLIFPQ